MSVPIPSAPAQRLSKGVPTGAAVAQVCEEDVASARAVAAVCQQRNEACLAYLRQFDNMRAAVDVSFATLSARVAALGSIFARLKAPVAEQLGTLNALAQEYPSYLAAMEAMELPGVLARFVLSKSPQLQAAADARGGALRLVDLVPAQELTAYVKKSKDYAGSLGNELARVEEQVGALQKELEPLQARLQITDADGKQRVAQLGALAQQAAAEFAEVRAAAEDFARDAASARGKPPDAVVVADETMQEHEITLSQLSQWEANSSSRYSDFNSAYVC